MDEEVFETIIENIYNQYNSMIRHVKIEIMDDRESRIVFCDGPFRGLFVKFNNDDLK